MGHTWAMTEQEAEAMGARLARIWEPSEVSMSEEHQNVEWHQKNGHLHFISSFNAYVHFAIFSALGSYIFVLKRQNEQTVTGNLSCVLSTGQLTNKASNAQAQESQFIQFESQWLPYFRRGCWLSGCPIEATAHEKAEWMQG